MNQVLLGVVSVMGLVWMAAPATAATKVFLLGGQSNMEGVGGMYETYENGQYHDYVVPVPSPYDAPQPAVKLWNYLGTNANGNGGDGYGNGWVTLEPIYGYPGYAPIKCFGPEVTFGYTLHNLFPNDDIYLVKYAKSGTRLATDWNPAGVSPSGDCYRTFQARVDGAMQNLTDAGLSPAIAGMIWMQGEGDAKSDSQAAAYAANLTHFIATARSDFSTPDMPFVLGRITTSYGTPANNALVRSAQESVPGLVGNSSWMNTDDLSWAYTGHYGTQGQIELGIRFADEFAPTPEPSALVLAATGLLALAGYRSCRKGRENR
jgi:hypothetical protein